MRLKYSRIYLPQNPFASSLYFHRIYKSRFQFWLKVLFQKRFSSSFSLSLTHKKAGMEEEKLCKQNRGTRFLGLLEVVVGSTSIFLR